MSNEKQLVRWSLALVVLLLLAISLSCAPGGVSQGTITGSKPQPGSSQGNVQQTGKSEWERTVEAAKKEGKVTLLLTAGSEPREAITRNFYSRFGITVDVISGSGGELVQKLIRERSAGLYDMDVFVGGSTTPIVSLKPAGILDPLPPALMLPDLTDSEQIKKTWFGGDLLWVDAEKKYHLAFLAFVGSDMAINTSLVNSKVDLNSYKDLLNPKWKGKIIQHDPTVPGNGALWFAIYGSKIVGFDFMRELVNQQPIITRDHSQIGNWLAQGKAAIALAPKPEVITDLARQGAPVLSYHASEVNYLSCGSGSLALINKAPHPNAAKLFINWLLSKEGVTVFSQSYSAQSARLDVPTEGLPPASIRQPGGNYIVTDREDILVKMPEFYVQAKQIFAPLLR